MDVFFADFYKDQTLDNIINRYTSLISEEEMKRVLSLGENVFEDRMEDLEVNFAKAYVKNEVNNLFIDKEL